MSLFLNIFTEAFFLLIMVCLIFNVFFFLSLFLFCNHFVLMDSLSMFNLTFDGVFSTLIFDRGVGVVDSIHPIFI